MTRIRASGGSMAASLLGGMVVATAQAGASPSCTTGTGMEICVTYDSSVTALANAATIEAAFNGAAQSYSNALTNNTSAAPIAIDVKFASLAAGNVSTSATSAYTFGSFSNVTSALQPVATAHGYTIPTIDPTGGALWFMPQAQAKVLGLTLPSNAGVFDGTISFSAAASFGFTSTLAGLQFSFQAAAEHEIGEVLGRTSMLNVGGSPPGNNWAEPFDLFRYGAPNTNSFSENGTAYASVNGGNTDLGTLETTIAGADRSDWSSPINNTTTDAQNSALTLGQTAGPSISDGIILQALGYAIAPDNGAGLFQASNNPVGAAAGLTNIPSTVPEPAGMTLLAGGAALAGLLHRGRTRSA